MALFREPPPTPLPVQIQRFDSGGRPSIDQMNYEAAYNAWLARFLLSGTVAFAQLPAAATFTDIGAVLFVSNGRKIGEGAGAGTGVLAAFSGGQWRRVADDAVVAV